MIVFPFIPAHHTPQEQLFRHFQYSNDVRLIFLHSSFGYASRCQSIFLNECTVGDYVTRPVLGIERYPCLRIFFSFVFYWLL